MEKPLFSLTLLSILLFSSCEKENPVTTSNNDLNANTTSKNTPSQSEKANNMAVSTWFDHGGTNFGCSGNPTNCLDEIIITPSLADIITDFGDADSQEEYANQHYATLKEIIDESLLDNVVLGDNQVTFKGEITSTSRGYLIFKDGSTVKSVYQFKS